jgi:hypothetical protein
VCAKVGTRAFSKCYIVLLTVTLIREKKGKF